MSSLGWEVHGKFVDWWHYFGNLWEWWWLTVTVINCCWWSLWMLFVLFEFAWKREVCAIINPAKIGMILRLSMLPESNQMIRERSTIILYPFWTLLHRFLLVKYWVLCRNQRSEDPNDCIKDLDILHDSWSIFGSLSPLSPGKAQFISQIVKIAHKIRNCVYITSILSFHNFISISAILTYHNWSSIRVLFEVMSLKISAFF